MADAGTSGCELTVARALRSGRDALAAAGCDAPRLDAERLLAHALGVARSYLYTHPERCLTGDEARAWDALLHRRQEREPLAYILGHWEFYGLDLLVDARVLVPRPETELIVERVVGARLCSNDFSRSSSPDQRGEDERLKSLLHRGAPLIWDVATGSGALALAIATHLPAAHVVASDISAGALQVAAANRARLGLETRVQLVRCDLLSATRGPLDVLVANLPYLTEEECATAMPEVAQFEPRLALSGGTAGLDLVERLLAQAAALDAAPALLLFEIGALQGPAALELAARCFTDRPRAVLKDLAGLDRVLEIGPASLAT